MADKNIGKITQVIGAVLRKDTCRRSTMRLRLRARTEKNLW